MPSSPTATIVPNETPGSVDEWALLRNSFVMADCESDASILTLAKRYTKNPNVFEQQMREAEPSLAYVQQVASHYDVAGEFVLLPWVESYFQPAGGRHDRPAGMWQLMPATASSIGLRADAHYDARFDVDASANAVMKLLKSYHDDLHDWRLVDYAYNAGESQISKLVQMYGAPHEKPVIPRMAVRNGTREHLARLLAIACVVREPARFGVTLPTLGNNQHLVQVKVDRSMPISQAAAHAGMPVDALKNLNSAFRTGMVDTGASPYLLMPASHAQQFRDALIGQSGSETADIRPYGPANNLPPLMENATADTPSAYQNQTTHTVKRGETLQQIAHHYSVSVTQLQRWNHLRGSSIKPGLVLKLHTNTR